MGFSIIIPAQGKNQYHELGDLSTFGGTTLLEWKISQCKDFIKTSEIYVSSSSLKIKEVCQREGVNFIERMQGDDYKDMLNLSLKIIPTNTVIVLNSTSPFMGGVVVRQMYKNFLELNLGYLTSVQKKYEYIVFKNKRLNFTEEDKSRKEIDPIYILTNGCTIIDKAKWKSDQDVFLGEKNLFKVDDLTSIEISEMDDYSMANELISLYFKRNLNV
jgi:CMP-N-acetylneuraminic acid synthetase